MKFKTIFQDIFLNNEIEWNENFKENDFICVTQISQKMESIRAEKAGKKAKKNFYCKLFDHANCILAII